VAQRQVGGAPEEVPAFAPLLAPLDLADVVVTTDALQTHPEAAEFLVTGKRAHYLVGEACLASAFHGVVGGRGLDVKVPS
jgi:hypothetical protein